MAVALGNFLNLKSSHACSLTSTMVLCPVEALGKRLGMEATSLSLKAAWVCPTAQGFCGCLGSYGWGDLGTVSSPSAVSATVVTWLAVREASLRYCNHNKVNKGRENRGHQHICKPLDLCKNKGLTTIAFVGTREARRVAIDVHNCHTTAHSTA